MQKRLFNQYKLKKKLKRVFSKDIRPIVSPDAVGMKSTKDFAWHRAKQNPFYRAENGIKRTVYLWAGFASLLGMAFLGIYHPFFHISRVEVSGLQRIGHDEFVSATMGILDYKKYFVLPAQSYFLTNVQEVKDILEERYPLSKIIVQKSFPSSLSILVEEKISTIIYDNGEEYSYLGLDGQIVEKIRKVGADEWKIEKQTVTSTDMFGNTTTEDKIISSIHVPPVQSVLSEMGDNPIVYDTRGKKGDINDLMLEKSEVNAIIGWYEFLNRHLQVPFGFLRVDNGQGDAVIRTRQGWDIKVNLIRNQEAQFQGLETTLKTFGENRHPQYIDVRFPGHVFWQ